MSVTMLFTTPDELLSQLKTLPSALTILPRALALLDDPNTSLDPLVDLIRQERSLAAKVIHLANSSAFPGAACETIETAVQRLGFKLVREAVVTLVASDSYSGALRLYASPAKELWRQSLATACAMSELAEKTNGDPQQAYVLGLLHNIGMVVIDRWVMAREPSTRLQQQPWPQEWQMVEERLLGFDQAAASAAVMRALGFPPLMVEATKYQGRPDGARQAYRMAALLYTARWVRCQFAANVGACQLPDEEVMRKSGLRFSDLMLVVQKVSVELDRLWGQFGFDAQQAA